MYWFYNDEHVSFFFCLQSGFGTEDKLQNLQHRGGFAMSRNFDLMGTF